MESSRFKYYQHKDCEFFPCHEIENQDDFNCIFCFCPLYALGSTCGGDFAYTDEGIKDCSECTIPHRQGGYEYVIEKLDEQQENKNE